MVARRSIICKPHEYVFMEFVAWQGWDELIRWDGVVMEQTIKNLGEPFYQLSPLS